MIVLGVVLLICGFVFKISILWTIGIILLVIGAVLWIMGSMGHAVGGRRHYYKPATGNHAADSIRRHMKRHNANTLARFTTRPSGHPGVDYPRRQT